MPAEWRPRTSQLLLSWLVMVSWAGREQTAEVRRISGQMKLCELRPLKELHNTLHRAKNITIHWDMSRLGVRPVRPHATEVTFLSAALRGTAADILVLGVHEGPGGASRADGPEWPCHVLALRLRAGPRKHVRAQQYLAPRQPLSVLILALCTGNAASDLRAFGADRAYSCEGG